MIKQFILAWILYWAAVLLLPVTSVYPAVLAAAGLQAAFVVLVVLGYSAATAALPGRPLPEAGSCEIAIARTLIRIALLMSLMGWTALVYDKVSVQGIQYGEGVAAAREEWRELGEDRSGASSVFSVLGYFFGSAYFVAVALALTQVRTLTSGERVRAMLACLALVLANSWITGGRSTVLLFAAVVMASMAARRGLRFRTLLPGRGQRRLLVLSVMLVAVYLLFVFYERAEAGDVDALEYALDFLPFLGLEAAEGYRRLLDGSAISGLSSMVVLALAYATHSFATVAAIVDAPGEDKTILFLHVASILAKLGVAQPPDGEWFLAGRMPSLPGALWHQFGGWGFVAGSLALGAAAALCRRWSAARPSRLFPLGACVLAHATLLLSPLLFAADFLSFPFAVGSFVQLAAVHALLRRTHSVARHPRARDERQPTQAAAPLIPT